MNKFWLAYDPHYGYVRGGVTVNPDLNGWLTYDGALEAAKKHLTKHRDDVYLLEGIKVVSFPEILDIKVTDLAITNDNVPTITVTSPEGEIINLAA
jgi:hypothetical protein